jgi:iron complex outermembrane receptor protein
MSFESSSQSRANDPLMRWVCPFFARDRSYGFVTAPTGSASIQGRFKGRGMFLMRLSVAVALCCLCMVSLSHAQTSHAAIRKDLNIPPENLSSALQAVGTTYELQVLYPTQVVGNIRTSGAVGSLTPDDALTKVLSGTGLSYKYLDANTVTVFAQPFQSANPAPSGIAPHDGDEPPKEAGNKNSRDFRVAQVDQTPVERQVGSSDATERKRKEEPLEEIVVTGTHIAGNAPIGSPVLVVTADQIVDSGYSTIGDVMRSVPQVSGGGINPGVVGAPGAANGGNTSSASTVNLRGLGSGSTLTLIDGYRMASDGYRVGVDISVIPLSAIDRVEILTDSASSIYGSDAVAGVANFILKKNFEGAETLLRFGSSSDGGATERQASQLFGVNWTGGNAMLSYEFYDQNALNVSDRDYTENVAEPTTLLPQQKRNSVFASVNQDISDLVSASLEGLYSDRKANTEYNTGDPTFQYDTTTAFFVAGGFAFVLPHQWSLRIDGTTSTSKDYEVTYESDSGVLVDDGPFSYNNRTSTAEAQIGGPLLAIWSGQVRSAFGAGYRRDTYSDSGPNSASRHVTDEFAEISVPLVLADSLRQGLNQFEVSASVRHEDYSDFGSTTNPKVGATYVPVPDLSLRASWGESFRAPDLLIEYGNRQLYASDGIYFGVPSPPGAQVLWSFNGNPALRPETARSWTAGFDYQPKWLDRSSINFTYFDINYSDRITYPIPNPTQAIGNPLYAPYITLNPSLAQQAALVAQSNYFVDGTSAGYDPNKVAAYIDDRYLNATTQAITGVDLAAKCGLHESFGDIDLSWNSTWLRIEQQLTPLAPTSGITGTVFNPPRFKARAGVSWRSGPWGLSSYVNHVSGETDNTGGGNVPVSPWTTTDMQGVYDASAWGGALRGFKLFATVENLFNRAPPVIAADASTVSGIRFDSTNASPLGRFVSVSIRKQW